MTRVKICGVRSATVSRAPVVAGADAVGVLVGQLHPSDHFVPVEQANTIFAALPPLVTGVLVSHREDPRALLTPLRRSGAGAARWAEPAWCTTGL
jgi:phosphoribosylanthranilate isomerase